VPLSVSVPKAAAAGGRTDGLRRIDRPAAPCGVRRLATEPVTTGSAIRVSQEMNTNIRKKLSVRVCGCVCV
jgi:hypothetical protein